MKLTIRQLLAAALILIVLLFATIWFLRANTAADEKPLSVALMSSISLQWGEAGFGAIAKGEAAPDPLFERLGEGRKLVAVDNMAQLQALKPDIAILIQPRAFSPDDLVRLDSWVRAGGRLLFFADPALQWPTELPMGDPQRPLFTSMHSPLFAHWGLELALPMGDDNVDAEAEKDIGGLPIRFASPGIWQKQKGGDGNCVIAANPIIAECRPGKGQVLLVADADMLDADIWQSPIPGTDNGANMLWVDRLIGALAKGNRVVSRAGEFVGN
jgi:hypothetical protein